MSVDQNLNTFYLIVKTIKFEIYLYACVGAFLRDKTDSSIISESEFSAMVQCYTYLFFVYYAMNLNSINHIQGITKIFPRIASYEQQLL